MDFFKFGLRNILGITLPGAVLVLVIFYVLYVCAIALGQNPTGYQWVADAEFLILVVLFLVSYVIGSVIRLISAGKVDDRSAKFKREEYWKMREKKSRRALRTISVKLCNQISVRIKEADISEEKLIALDKEILRLGGALLAYRSVPWSGKSVEALQATMEKALKEIYTETQMGMPLDVDDKVKEEVKSLRLKIKKPRFYSRIRDTRLSMKMGQFGSPAVENSIVETLKQAREKDLIRIVDEILEGEVAAQRSKEFDNWIWRDERFPYPVWQFRKLERYHRREVLGFFENHQHGILAATEIEVFFNYCKMAVYHKGKPSNAALVLEVNRAEATVRFFAGAYYALRYSFGILMGSLIIQFGVILFNESFQSFLGLATISISEPFRVFNIFITGTLTFAVIAMMGTIKRRFRTFRHREVDIVHDAFYLVNNP